MQTANHTSQVAKLELPGGKSLGLTAPIIMGILNVTPDSFYDGGKYFSVDDAVAQADKFISEGADILDLGAASTRPGAKFISIEEEQERVLPVIDAILKKHPEAILSIDTFHASVAKECVKHGASIVNDISGGILDENMLSTVAKLNVPYIIMHMQGTPQTMQVDPHYENVVDEVYSFLKERVNAAKQAGITQIIIDPGFGFGKTVEHNFSLLQNLSKFKEMGIPVLAGLSRKSMINKVLHTKPENALTGTIALNTIALLQGANILRVHDVKEAKQVIKLVTQYLHPETEV